MTIYIIERDMIIIMPRKSRPPELSNTTPASSTLAPTRASESLAICVGYDFVLLLSAEA
ncbi:hypothetical protein FH972_019462 [Carpinus fangiana]|uniref:Uncharacterized protein n=1 Tax=Carpinus fangiana TaxID=176857 RepID=A0A5N6RQI2_9ROSI|nr:hypothetical protein FH972_019462 [Carpinus fangiana]